MASAFVKCGYLSKVKARDVLACDDKRVQEALDWLESTHVNRWKVHSNRAHNHERLDKKLQENKEDVAKKWTDPVQPAYEKDHFCINSSL